MKKNFFVSYTIRDNTVSIEFLQQIEKFLQNFGTPFIDLLHNDSEDKQSRIENELYKSDCLILINTDKAKESEWVNKELSIACERNIPIYEYNFEDLIINKFQSIIEDINQLKISK
ncbi:MAG: toll/interleukin-1 receptor domain-containing protein [Flavobacteriales bacterium]|nr:toll/interleukin-1 receptor domain-containing protein [Flavobacteriales bacterium]